MHAAASAVGISAILVRSAAAFTVLKIAGACYLVLLGVLSFRAARRSLRERPHAEFAPAPRRSARASFLQGFLNDVLNPKPALFYLAFVPQFVGQEGSAQQTQCRRLRPARPGDEARSAEPS